jgi:glycosyltransferase involved in cell wall biosynthesis
MKFLMIAGFADDVIPFRGDLINALLDKGLEVHLALPDLEKGSNLEKIFLDKGIKLHHVDMQRAGMNPLADLNTLWQLIGLIRKVKPDIVFTYLIKCVIYGLLAATLLKVPRRFALITGLGYAFQGEGQRGMLQKLAQGLYAVALKGSHKTFFQNNDDLALFRELGILTADSPAYVVNGSGVNMQHYALTPLPKGPPRFLTIARFLIDKGVREYANAARIVKAKYPDVRFSIVGWLDENPSAIKQEEMDGWIAEGILENIGRLKDVRPAIADCSIYVLPSYREGVPRSTLEAMSMGRGVITTNAVGCKETVVEGENGFLVPVRSVDELAQAMLKIVENPELVNRFGQRSFELVKEKYDVHKVNQVMLEEMKIIA